MASANANLHKAKDAKNDEFYTQLTDVAKELMHYKVHFKDKIVLCMKITPIQVTIATKLREE